VTTAIACGLTVVSCGGTDNRGSSASDLRAYLGAVSPVDRDIHLTIPLIVRLVGSARQPHADAARLSIRGSLIADRLQTDAAAVASIHTSAGLRPANRRLLAAVGGIARWMTEISAAIARRDPSALRRATVDPDPAFVTAARNLGVWKREITGLARADHVRLPDWFTGIVIAAPPDRSLSQ
jgi:hypothetical protein